MAESKMETRLRLVAGRSFVDWFSVFPQLVNLIR